MPDFVKFCNNIEYYLKVEPTELKQNADTISYPQANLDDLIINCVHYNSFNEFKKVWNK